MTKHVTLNDFEWHLFFVEIKFKIYLFTYTDSAMISLGHIYACGVPEVFIIGIFMYVHGLCHQVK